MAQTILQQCSSLPGAWDLYVQLVNTVRTLLHVTGTVQCRARELVTPALLSSTLSAALPLLLQLHSCIPLLPAAGTSAGGSSGGGVSPLQAIVKAQSTQVDIIRHIAKLLRQEKLDAAAAAQVEQMLLEPTVQQLQLQHTVAWVALLYQDHA
jgi:hypothetical protein